MPSPFKRRLKGYGRSLQFKFTIGALALSLAAIWSVVLYASKVFLRDQRSLVMEQQLTISRHSAAELNQKFLELIDYTTAMAAHIDASRISTGNYAAEFLAQQFALRQDFGGGIIIYASDGTAMGDFPVVPGRRGTNYADRDYFKQAMQTGKPFVTPPFMARVLQHPIVTISVPLVGPARDVKGVITASIDLTSSGFLGLLSDSKLMGIEEFYLLSDRGQQIVASTDKRSVMRKLPESELARRLLRADQEAFVDTSSQGVEKVYAVSQVGAAGWSLVIALPTEIAFGPINRMLYALVISGVVLTLFCLVAAFWISRRLIGPLREVAATMDSMSSGKNPLRRIPETGDTEALVLIRSFNRLSDSIVQQQDLLIAERNELRDTKENLKELNASLEAKVAARTADLTAANQELDTFSSAVSHDLRAPVRAISGYVSILIKDFGSVLTGEGARYLERIRKNTTGMNEMIDAMLALARSARHELDRQTLDISAMATAHLEELARIEPDRNVTWQVEPGLQAVGDRRTIESVLANLLGNAWKYTGKTDAPVIRVAMGAIGNLRGICVSDNGAGFDMAHAAKLFEPFQRLHQQDEFPGTGVGLATVRRILRRHGGDIKVESAPGAGATFCFYLPDAAPAEAA